MNKPAEYRENAALCLEAMRAAFLPEVRDSLQSLAERWMELADRAEEEGDRDDHGRGNQMTRHIEVRSSHGYGSHRRG
jgi:hypothetical protein